jgi:hypothetical protein
MSDKDVNFLSYADQTGLTVRGLDVAAPYPATGESFDDMLKISHCTDCSFVGGTVSGGSENAVDLNRMCENISLVGLQLNGGAQASVVVKGGCTGVSFSDILINPDPRARCEFLIDDWSAQSRAPSDVSISRVTRLDGKPVRVIFGRFSRPRVVNAKVKILWISSIALHIYNLGKDALVALRLVKP